MANNKEAIKYIIAEMRDLAEHRDWHNHTGQSNRERVTDLSDRLEAALKREVDELNSAIQATVGRSDAEIDRLRREIAEMKRAGDCAKLREAAEKTRSTLEEALQILNGISDEEAGRLNARLEDVADAICEVTQWIIPDALATPATTEKSSAVGDCAKMREALSKFCAYSSVVLNIGMFNRVHLEALLNMAKAALATPPRQCDIGTDNEQIRRWKEFCDHYEVDRSPESFARWGQGPYFDSISEGEEEPETNTQAKEGGAI